MADDDGIPLQEIRRSTDAAEAAAAPYVDARTDEFDHEEEEREPTPEETRENLRFYAEQVVRLMVPIGLTFMLTIWFVDTIYGGKQILYNGVLLYREETDDSFWAVLGGSLVNALIILGAVLISTCIFVCLFYYNYMKIIYAWIGSSTAMILGGIGGLVFYNMLNEYNLPFDWLSLVFILLNFAGVGLVAIFWHSPLLVTQGFLILISAFMATNLVALPEWTTWALLATIATYDIFAVLCPGGPLKLLVNTAQSRNQTIPGLLYSAGMARQARYTPAGVYVTVDVEDNEPAVTVVDDDEQDLSSLATSSQRPVVVELAGPGPAGAAQVQDEADAAAREELDRNPVQLGLGDFVFYSVLVGRAALTDWTTVVTCAAATIVGLCVTLFVLALQRKPLPALPISIALGFVFYFATSWCMSPLMAAFAARAAHL